MSAGQLTNAGAAHIIGGGSLKSGSTYLALYTGNPTVTGSHSTELAASLGYSRKAVSWSSTGTKVETNTTEVNFTASGGTWSTVTHWGLVNSPTRGAGTMMAFGALDAPRTLGPRMQIRFSPGFIELEGLT